VEPDPSTFAQAVVEVANDPSHLREASLALANDMSWPRIAERHLAIYEQLLHSQP
jgi:hypothetical protein